MTASRPRWPRYASWALLLALISGCSGGGAPETDTEKALEIELPSIDGSAMAIADHSGKVVAVDFWATWCVPCRLQAEIFHDLQSELAQDKVNFLAVSVGEEEVIVRDFAQANPFSYPVLIDTDEEVAGPLGVFALPTVMVIGKDGRVVYLQAGISGKEALVEVIREALQAPG